MQENQLGLRELGLLWEEVLAHLDLHASKSPSFDDFRQRLGLSGWSFDLRGDRRIAGSVHVSGPEERVTVSVCRLDAQRVEISPFRVFSLKEVWKALTVPQLPLR